MEKDDEFAGYVSRIQLPNGKVYKLRCEVVEVYRIFEWLQASEDKRETIEFDAAKEKGRIIFKGEVAAEEIRKKYIGKDVRQLYKRGEANPVKVFLAHS